VRQWEYKIIEFYMSKNQSSSLTNDLLNESGKDGWEAAGITCYGDAIRDLLKRETSN
jgi:hypothetical protein